MLLPGSTRSRCSHGQIYSNSSSQLHQEGATTTVDFPHPGISISPITGGLLRLDLAHTIAPRKLRPRPRPGGHIASADAARHETLLAITARHLPDSI
jgi:hypothetical protein